MRINWTPADEDARIRFEGFKTTHGGNSPMIMCDTADDGSLTIPASIVDGFLGLSFDGWGSFWLTRYRRGFGAVDQGNSVGLEVASMRGCTPMVLY